MIRYPLSFFAVLLVGLPVVHACPRACYHAPFVAPVVVVPTAPVFVPIAIPLYGVSYQPGYQLPPAVVAAPLPPTTPPVAVSPAAAPAPIPAAPSITAPQASGATAPAGAKASMLQTLCASCHGEQTAATKGKGLVIVQGGLRAALSPQQTKDALKAVWTGTMPRGSKPTDEQVSQAIDELIQ